LNASIQIILTVLFPDAIEILGDSSVEDNVHLKIMHGLFQMDRVYHWSPLAEAFRRSSVHNFSNGSLIIDFQLFFDRRKLPSSVSFISFSSL